MATDFYKYYKPITTPEVDEFLKEGLAFAIKLLGEPVIQIRQVYLRLSMPIDSDSGLKQGFQLTEIVDPDAGEFAIYLRHRPEDYSFYGQFAHEIAHLLNAQIYDAYVEGLNTVFADKLLMIKGKDWTGWESWFKTGNDSFYAFTYYMMKEVDQIASKKDIRSFLRFAEPESCLTGKMQINIEAWINSLTEKKRELIRGIISKYALRVKDTMKNTHLEYSFHTPGQ
jgi:hypothetical protein